MVHNAAKTLAPVLAHWERNRIGVRVIDHGSTDGTADIIRRHRGCSIIEASYHEFDGVFRLKQQLQAKEAIVRGLAADWVIHADGDEIFESPVEGENLRQMIERIDSAGFDVVDCDEFVFVPISESREPKDFVSELRSYYGLDVR